MSVKYKIGLTRNRLFDFDNCVSFLGVTEENLDADRCVKVLKTLCLKEPLLCCGIELCQNGEAYLVEGKNEIGFDFFQGDIKEYVQKKEYNGFDFSKQLFSFALINGNVLGIFAHTVVADVRSLLYIAGAFMDIYKSSSFSVVPSEFKVISEISQMPSNVFSIVIDRIASDLELDWQKKSKFFSCEDYERAKSKYLSSKTESETITFSIDPETFCRIKNFADSKKVDVSSLVAFAFHESLTKVLGGKKKFKKLNVQANGRVFFEEFDKMKIGAFNGFVAVKKKKDKKRTDNFQNNAVSFHKEIYKSVTSAFKVFYNEFLLMRVPESYADSQYMYCAGEFPHKCSEKLAHTYGCANEVAGEFCSYNLNQEYWTNLNVFKELFCGEPLKMRSATMITFVEKGDTGKICFTYNKNKVNDSQAQNVVNGAVELIKKF